MPLLPAVTTTASSKSFTATAKSVMDATVAKKEQKKRPGFKNN